MKPEKLEIKVRRVLEDFPETRNNDILLQLQIIKLYSSGKYDIISFFTNDYVSVDSLREFNLDYISRVRRVVQNTKGDFLPTDPQVRKNRRISEEMWRDYVGAPVGLDGGNPSFT